MECLDCTVKNFVSKFRYHKSLNWLSKLKNDFSIYTSSLFVFDEKQPLKVAGNFASSLSDNDTKETQKRRLKRREKKMKGPNRNVIRVLVGTSYQNLVQKFVVLATECNHHEKVRVMCPRPRGHEVEAVSAPELRHNAMNALCVRCVRWMP